MIGGRKKGDVPLWAWDRLLSAWLSSSIQDVRYLYTSLFFISCRSSWWRVENDVRLVAMNNPNKWWVNTGWGNWARNRLNNEARVIGSSFARSRIVSFEPSAWLYTYERVSSDEEGSGWGIGRAYSSAPMICSSFCRLADFRKIPGTDRSAWLARIYQLAKLGENR